MNYKISFQEMNKLAQEVLSKQSPVTLEKAKKQVQALKNQSSQKLKKVSS